MNFKKTDLPEVLLLEPRSFPDARGYFFELWNKKRYEDGGIPSGLVQDNVSSSKKGVLRGLHYQLPCAQGKLVTALSGQIFDAAVDIRKGSPTFGKWISVVLSEENHHQLYVPPGFAHGFIVLSEEATVLYKVSEYWRPDCERTLLWNDPDLGIQWPISIPILSDKDAKGMKLAEMPVEHIPQWNH